MALIELNHISKHFQDGEARVNHVLRNLHLEVNKGDFLAVRGRSGAGKTTLLNILGTLLLPDEGSYLLDGQSLQDSKVDLASVRNQKIGFVFQDHRLLPQYTVLQNILLPVLAKDNQVSDEKLQWARLLMDYTQISSLETQYPSTLSGGEACRVAVCRALINRPLLLLADEPTGQLDKDNAQHIATLFRHLNEDMRTTIIMVTHADETASVAQHVATLSDGVLIFDE